MWVVGCAAVGGSRGWDVIQRKIVMNNDPIDSRKDIDGNGDVKDLFVESFLKLEESSRRTNDQYCFFIYSLF